MEGKVPSYLLTVTKSHFGKTKHFNVAPRVGYFVLKNLVVGAQLTYDYTTTDPGLTGYYSTATTARAFARYYSGAIKPEKRGKS